MIPMRTLQPLQRRAYATYALILINALVFLWELMQGQRIGGIFMAMAFNPCQVGALPVGDVSLNILRSMFLHGSWEHLIGNMTFLWIFGRNIEDFLGWRKYLGLYLFWGAAAALIQAAIGPGGFCIPMIGASGAISGVLGSYLICYPGARVKVMVIFFRFFPAFFKVPALAFIGLWFIFQLFQGVLSLGVDTLDGGIAFWAHIGGFIVGMVTVFIYILFAGPPQRYREED